MKVRDVMTHNVKSVTKDCTLQQTANDMKNLNVGSIPVCDNSQNIVGIVTDRDLIVRGLTNNAQSQDKVGDVMTSDVIMVSPDDDINEAATLMSQNQIRRLPVVEGNKVVGMLSIGDLAVRDKLTNEAGNALSDISEPSKPIMY